MLQNPHQKRPSNAIREVAHEVQGHLRPEDLQRIAQNPSSLWVGFHELLVILGVYLYANEGVRPLYKVLREDTWAGADFQQNLIGLGAGGLSDSAGNVFISEEVLIIALWHAGLFRRWGRKGERDIVVAGGECIVLP